MNYPSINEYKEAILFAEDNFEQLKNLRPVLDEEGNPVMTSGNFAVVFKMKDEQTGKLHAVKCFLREQEGRAEAYRQIAEELEYVSSTFLTPIKYLDKELFVDSANSEDSEFPVLLMDWVEGQTLDKYIREHIDDQYELSLLAYQFSRLAMWLMPQPFAHGDLKPDNILVKENGTLVLVDYDGMYVPAMKGQRARELGSPDFRHPSRTEEVFDDHIDDFSLASILLSLKAIALQPSLLEEYGASDRLLFSERDYRNLSESSALGALKPLMQDAELASLYSLYILALSQNNLSGVSFRLFNLRKPRMTSPNILGKSITKKEILASFQGKKNVIHYVNRDGSDIWIAGKQRFLDEVKSKGGSRINIIENDKEHVIYLYDVNDNEVGKYYIVEELRGKAPKTISEIKDNVIVLEVWINSMKKWFWGIGIEKHISKEILPSFQGKEKVWHIVDSNGKSSYMTQSWSFDDEVYAKGACKLNIVENDRKHVLFLFNDRNEEVGRYYIGKKIQGLTPKQMTEIKNELCFFESWNPETRTWVPCVGKIKDSNEDKEYIEKYGKTKSEYLKENFNEVNTLTAVCLKNVYDYYQHEDYSELEVGKIYQVTHIGVFRSYTKIMLNGFGNKQYNSTCFEIYENGESINKTFAKDPRFEAPYLRERYKRHHLDLLNDSIEEKNLSTVVTDEDLANAWTDEYGVKYSIDRKRLLRVNETLTSYSIKEGTKVICDDSFGYDFGNRYIKSINIPNSVVRIGYAAFRDCEVLTNITLPDSVELIGEKAFSGCKSLSEIFLPNSITQLGDCAFYECESLLSINIPNSISFIGESVFSGCSFSHIKIPNTIKKIGNYAFYRCNNLEEVSIPDSVTDLGAGAFGSCSSLKHVKIPNSITELGYEAFSGSALTHIELPKSIKKIGSRAFWDSSLTQLEIPYSVIKIEEGAFYGSCLEEIVLPESITEIADSAFYDCFSLKQISIPNSVTRIGDSAFYGCSCLSQIEIPDSIKFIGGGAFLYCESLTQITIPDSVVELGNVVFSNCHSLKYITFSGVVNKIGDDIFHECDALDKILISTGTRNKFEELLPEYKDKLVEISNVVSITFDNSSTSKVDRCRVFKKDNDWKLEIVYKNGMKIEYPHSLLEGNQSIVFDKQTIEKIQLYVGYCEGFYINPKAVKVDFEYPSKFSAKILFDSDFIEISGITWGLNNNINEWKVKGLRSFNIEERLAVNRAEVVPSDYGNSVCFFMNAGGQTYIPLDKNSELCVGDALDMNTAKIITLCRKGKSDIVRVME